MPMDRSPDGLRPRPRTAAQQHGAGVKEPCPFGCGTEIIYCRMKDGEIVPVTLFNQWDGNVLVFKATGHVIEARVFAGEVLDGLKAQAVPLRKLHTVCE